MLTSYSIKEPLWSRDNKVTDGFLLPERPTAELKKDGPLLEIITDLLKFSFFLNNYSRYKELETLYNREDDERGMHQLFSPLYFSGTVILLALFDIDSHWEKDPETGIITNKQIPLIIQFGELVDTERPHDFSFATLEQFRPKFQALYNAIGNFLGRDYLEAEDSLDDTVDEFLRLLKKEVKTKKILH